MKRFVSASLIWSAATAAALAQSSPAPAPAPHRQAPANNGSVAPATPQRNFQPRPIARTQPPTYGNFSGVRPTQSLTPRYYNPNLAPNAPYRGRFDRPRTGEQPEVNAGANSTTTAPVVGGATQPQPSLGPGPRWSGRTGNSNTNQNANWNGGNRWAGGTNDWRNRNPNVNGGNWNRNGGNWQHHGGNGSGNFNDAWRRYHHDHHDRNWWHAHYPRIALINNGYYYWDTGWWYPAWGYDSAYNYYAYDGPIYGYGDLPPDQVVANVQQALTEAGYYFGAIDGQLGPMTRQAIAAWQRDQGLAITTVVDEPTIQSLGI